MRLKLLLCSLCLSAIAFTASAQDKINLQNGGVINAKVKEVSTRTITYKKKDNPDGPDFVIRKNEVESITYANGTTDKIDDDGDDNDEEDRRGHRRPREPREGHHMGLSHEKYPKNILSIAPMQMANEGPAGVGLHYERVIDKKSMFSFYLPVAAIFYTDNHTNYNSSGTTDKVQRTFCYFYPGIKVYPTGSNRRVSYGIGASFALGFGNKYVYEYNPVSSSSYVERNVFKSGLLLNNSLNIQPTKHLYIGLELGLGFTYYNNEDGYNSTSFDTGDAPLVQFNFGIGYRF